MNGVPEAKASQRITDGRDEPGLNAPRARADAPAHARREQSSEPLAAGALRNLANIAFAAGRVDDARRLFEEIARQSDGQARDWLVLGALHSGARDQGAAEHAYGKALTLDPDLSDASFGLGLIYLQQHRYREAATRLRRAVAGDCRDSGAYACLGQALYLIGEFADAACAFDAADQLSPGDAGVVRKRAFLALLDALRWGSAADALDAWRSFGVPPGEDVIGAALSAFYVLAGYGHLGRAKKLVPMLLDARPNDPVLRHHAGAVAGESVAPCSPEYIVTYFDRFAGTFDSLLLGVLHYHAHEDLCARLAAGNRTFARILDVGCGTGLAAPLLSALGASLTGVDLSSKMLAKAHERGAYEQLYQADLVSFLSDAESPFDLVFAADVLIYFGDLSALMAAVAKATVPGGVFALTIETATSDFALNPSGRFSHSVAHIEATAGFDFELVECLPTIIRMEADRPVEGALIQLRRRGGAPR